MVSPSVLVATCLLVVLSTANVTTSTIVRRDVSEDVQNWYKQLPGKFEDAYKNVKDYVSNTYNELKTKAMSMTDTTNMDKLLDNFKETVSKSYEALILNAKDQFQKMKGTPEAVKTQATEYKDQIIKTGETYSQQLNDLGKQVGDKLKNSWVTAKFQEAAAEVNEKAQHAAQEINEEMQKITGTSS